VPLLLRPDGGWERRALAEATHGIAQGGLVVFPTETVYGIGADLRRPAAVARLRLLKGLDPARPLLLHCPDASWLEQYAAAVPAYARRLAEAFWPGPLALVFAKSASVPRVVCGSGDTVGIRVVDHPVTRTLLSTLGSPLAGTSANLHGQTPPGRLDDVPPELRRGVDIAIDGGTCVFGAASTVVDASSEHPRLLRTGVVSRDAIEALLGFRLA